LRQGPRGAFEGRQGAARPWRLAPASQCARAAGAGSQRPAPPRPPAPRPRTRPATATQSPKTHPKQVLNKQVITRTSGRALGALCAAWIDPGRRELVSFDLDDRRPGPSGGGGASLPLVKGAARVGNLPLGALRQIGDVVLVHDESGLYEPDLDGRLGFVNPVGLEVRTAAGEFLGKVRPRPGGAPEVAEGGARARGCGGRGGGRPRPRRGSGPGPQWRPPGSAVRRRRRTPLQSPLLLNPLPCPTHPTPQNTPPGARRGVLPRQRRHRAHRL
jgi:hypothetical protein